EHSKRFGDRTVLHLAGIRVPTDADALVTAMLHDGFHVRRILRSRSVNLHPYFDARCRRGLAALDEGSTDLRKRLCDGNAFRKPVGTHFHAGPTQVGHELNETLTLFDILLNNRRVGRMKLARATGAPKDHTAIGKLLFHLASLAGGKRRLDTVRMGRATLDRCDTDVLANAEDRW